MAERIAATSVNMEAKVVVKAAAPTAMGATVVEAGAGVMTAPVMLGVAIAVVGMVGNFSVVVDI